MSKFKLRLKLQGLELDIEGDRRDVPQMAQAIGQQIAGIIEAPAGLAAPAPVKDVPPLTPTLDGELAAKPARRRRPGSAPTKSATANTYDWKHDPAKWGSPSQEWSTSKKSLWLLAVVEGELGIKELSTADVVATFNKHFRQAGLIRNSHVNRDLGKLKASGRDSAVGQDTSNGSNAWFLTEAGRKQAEKLIKDAAGAG